MASEGWGDRVRRFRRSKQWAQHDLADRAGIDRRYVGRIEAGQVGNPDPDTVRKLAAALEMPIRAIAEPLGWYDDTPPTDAQEEAERAIRASSLSEERKQAALVVIRDLFGGDK